MIITRPQLPLTGPISRANLQQLNDVTVALEQTDMDAINAETLDHFGTGVARPNYFRNPGLDVWTRGASAVSCAVGVRQLRADDWWTRTASTSADLPTYQRVANAGQDFLYGARLTGGTGVGIVDFGQDLTARVAAALTPELTVTFTIANGTSASLTPLVRIDSCDAFEDYTAVTNRASVAVAVAVASGATSTVSVTLDVSAATAALRNGALLYIRIPSGALNSNIKTVDLSALKVEDGDSATANTPERDPADPADVAVAERHFVINGDLGRDQWVNTSTTAPAGIDTYGPLGWFTNSSNGSTLVVARDTSAPSATTFYSAKLTGGVAITGTVDFGQNIAAANAARLARSCVFSAWIYNDTGAAISPQARLDTCTTADRFDTATNQVTETLASCANGAWTQVSFAFDGSAVSDIANGARIYLRFTAGMLNTGIKIVKIAQLALELGAVVSPFDPPPVFEMGSRLPLFSPDFRITSPSGGTLGVYGDFAVLAATSGLVRTVAAVSTTINSAINGAGGLDTGTVTDATAYTVWLIAKDDGTVAGLLSTSETAPLMPAGYSFRLRIGWVYYTTALSFGASHQQGRSVRYAPRVVFSAKSVTTLDVWQTLRSLAAGAAGYLAPFAPTWAQRLVGIASCTSVGVETVIHFAATLDTNNAGSGETVYALGPAVGGQINPTRTTGLQAHVVINLPAAAPGTALDAYVRTHNVRAITFEATGFDF